MDKEQLELGTEKGFRTFVERYIFKGCSDIMDTVGEILPVAHVIARINSETREPLEQPGIVTVVCQNMATDKDKDGWTDSIRKVSSNLSACGAIVINEAWMVKAPKEDYTKNIRPSESPNRVEVVMIMLEHIAIGREMWMADIIREEGKPPRLSEFKKLFDSKGKEPGGFEGRFTGFIPNTSKEMN